MQMKPASRVLLVAAMAACGLTRQAVVTAESHPAVIKRTADAQQPMTPEVSATKIRLPEGFQIDLVAAEPMVEEPSCIAFDERGRLFVCELHGYNIEGHIDVTELNKTGKLDRKVRRIRWELQGGKIAEEAAKLQFGVVKMLTDVDGDGRMDKVDVLADDLPPCYGVIPARDGVIVVCAPDILFFADKDGDGRPDVRETLFTGFRTRVLERGINNPRWGLDNWIYIGAGSDGGTITGPHLDEPVVLQHSDFRIKADGSAIESVSGRVGTFGLTMNDVGDWFPSTGGRPAMSAVPLPARYLKRNPHVATPETNYYAATYNRGFRISRAHPWRVKRQQDPAWVKFYGTRETNSSFFSGGCSNTFYGDTLFPEQYRGNIFYCEPSLNIVHRCVVTRDGAGYKGERAPSEQESEFLASTDQWFRPMNLRVGPDGALYIVDMYREIIEDYSAIPRFLQQQYGLDRGGDHGRIWRLAPTDETRRSIDDLSRFSETQLVESLDDASFWRRLTAQRLLIQRSAVSAATAVGALIHAKAAPHGIIHAMYTLDGLGRLQAAHVANGLQHEHHGVRRHALRLAERWLDDDDAIAAAVYSMTGDPDPSVRLQLAMTCGESRSPQAVDALLVLAGQHGDERWMPTAILSSATDHTGELLIGLLRRSANEKTRGLLQPLSATIAGRRDADVLSFVLAGLAGRDEGTATACLDGFLSGLAQGREPIPESADGWASVARLLTSESAPIRERATQLAAKLPLADDEQLRSIFSNAVSRALDAGQSTEQRRQAIQTLASSPYDTLAPVSTRFLDAKQPPLLQHAAIASLAASSDKRVGAALLKNWSGFTPATRVEVLQTIFARSNRLPALLVAVEDGAVPPGDINTGQREQLTATRDQATATRARELFANPAASAELQQRIDLYQKALSAERNIERGEQVFVMNCLTCHKLRNKGHDVGPPLGSLVSKPDVTILLELLDPSAHIEPEYRSYIVTTEDGRVFTGILVSESPTSVTLRKEKGETRAVLRKDIDLIKASEISLMPSNLHENINPRDAADLIAFLRKTFQTAVKPPQR